jgi:hypothetical protein
MCTMQGGVSHWMTMVEGLPVTVVDIAFEIARL